MPTLIQPSRIKQTPTIINGQMIITNHIQRKAKIKPNVLNTDKIMPDIIPTKPAIGEPYNAERTLNEGRYIKVSVATPNQ